MENCCEEMNKNRYDEARAVFFSISEHLESEVAGRPKVEALVQGMLERHQHLQDITGIYSVKDVNLAAREERAFDVINVSEAVQARAFARLADAIVERDTVRLVLIAGPTSSGKTTFCKSLSIQLRAVGLIPVLLSLDDYFLNRSETPRDADGDYDFESLYAIDLDLFNRHLAALVDGEEVELPRYDFETGSRVWNGKRMCLTDRRSVLIIEGNHALNPELTRAIPDERKYRIFLSVCTGIALDETAHLPPNDNRLLRRILRDRQFRAYSAEDTIARWSSVRRGEERWIFPFLHCADVLFNTSFFYELAVMKEKVEPFLDEVKEESPAYETAQRLKHYLGRFVNLSDSAVPPTSLLREFLGGSSYIY